MSEKQAEFTKIFRLYNASLALSGLVATLITILYVVFFIYLDYSAATNPEPTPTGFGVSLAIIFGVIALLTILFTIGHGLVAWKFDQPKKWVWVLSLILLILQLFNLYFLPVNIYFLIKHFDNEFKDYYK